MSSKTVVAAARLGEHDAAVLYEICKTRTCNVQDALTEALRAYGAKLQNRQAPRGIQVVG